MASDSVVQDVKTLLLCNATGRYVYEEIYKGGANTSGASYFTLGGVDAISIYPTPKTNENAWLEDVYRDKEEVIRQMDNNTTYHPIHLVRYVKNELILPPLRTFLLVTFVYGLSADFEKNLQENDNWSIAYDPKKNGYAFVPTNAPINSENSRIEIYQCINISDRVILSYTSNIHAAFSAICRLETTGCARKTYTMINFLLGGDGRIEKDILNNIQSRLMQRNLTACIRGSIQNSSAWQNCYAAIKKIAPQKTAYYVNYGEADFTISITGISGTELVSLLDYYQNNSKELSDACWDIHTELQYKHKRPPLGDKNAQVPQQVLQRLKLENTLLDPKLEKAKDTFNWNWLSPLMELFSAQKNIERNPVLHGPSYLLWDSFRVINDYLTTAIRENNQPIYDINDIKALITDSRKGLERSVRCLSQLTDQLTRNDDIIYRGIGRIPAIATTIPENLLEFYHAFLHQIAGFLVGIVDKREKYLPQQYRYGFLIAPEFYKRAQISQVFNTEHGYRIRTDGKEFHSWPAEQIHIIQLPISYIFHPMQCMIPLAHECFHFFGDYLRQRKIRAIAMSIFLSNLYVDIFSIDYNISKSARISVAKSLAVSFQQKDVDESELYLSNVEDYLVDKFRLALAEEGVNKLYIAVEKKYDFSPEFLMYDENISKRTEYLTHFSSLMETNAGSILTPRAMISYCCYYYKECYADFMSIVTLGLTPQEHLNSLLAEMKLQAKSDYLPDEPTELLNQRTTLKQVKLVLFAQRMSIVLAALNLCGFSKRERIVSAIQNAPYEDALSGDGDIFKTQIFTTFFALVDKSKRPLASSKPGVFPASSLRTVVDYLVEIYKPQRMGKYFKEILSLRKKFSKLIRREQIFSPVTSRNTSMGLGAEIIKANRNRVKREAEAIEHQ